MDQELFSLNGLRVFLAAAENGQLKTAADRLQLTPSAVSQAILKLEESLGVPLFDRSVRPFRLTRAGEVLLSEGKDLLSSAERLAAKLADQNDALQLRIGLSETVTATIGPWLTGLLAERIDQLNTVTDLTKPMVQMLLSNKLDVLISPDGMLEEDGWQRKALYREKFLLVVPSHTPMPRTLEELNELSARLPFVGYGLESSDHDEAERLLRLLNIRPSRRITVSSSYSLVGFIAEQGGWSFLPITNLWCGRLFISEVSIGAIPAPFETFRTMWAVAKEQANAQLMAYCIACAQEAAKKMKATLSSFENTLPNCFTVISDER